MIQLAKAFSSVVIGVEDTHTVTAARRRNCIYVQQEAHSEKDPSLYTLLHSMRKSASLFFAELTHTTKIYRQY